MSYYQTSVSKASKGKFKNLVIHSLTLSSNNIVNSDLDITSFNPRSHKFKITIPLICLISSWTFSYALMRSIIDGAVSERRLQRLRKHCHGRSHFDRCQRSRALWLRCTNWSCDFLDVLRENLSRCLGLNLVWFTNVYHLNDERQSDFQPVSK